MKLADNEIYKVKYVDKLKQLRKLALWKIRIRQIDSYSFHSHLIISCLKLDDNLLMSLANIDKLQNLIVLDGKEVTMEDCQRI